MSQEEQKNFGMQFLFLDKGFTLTGVWHSRPSLVWLCFAPVTTRRTTKTTRRSTRRTPTKSMGGGCTISLLTKSCFDFSMISSSLGIILKMYKKIEI